METFDAANPSSRSSPDSSDFEKVEKEDLIGAPSGMEPDSSTGGDALRGGGDSTKAQPESTTSPKEELADLFGFLQSLPPPVLDLVYWRRPASTGCVFGASLALLFSLSMYSTIAVASYAALCVLTTTFSFVVYRKCLAAIQKSSGDANPFKAYLGDDALDAYKGDCQRVLESVLGQVGKCVVTLRHYFLIVDVLDSIKFALFLWFLTYIGACFNLLTLLILLEVSLFTLPKIYEVHRAQIDSYVNLVMDQLRAQYPVIRTKVDETFGAALAKVTAMIPGKAKAQ